MTNDLISRTQAIDALDEQIKFCDNALCDFNISLKDEYAVKVERASLCAYKEILEDLPPAQPPHSGRRVYMAGYAEGYEAARKDRKTGRWINIRHDNIAECSRCGITGRAWMNFCFDCGADMREENT